MTLFGFVDAASGAGTDSFALGISIRSDNGRAILACLREHQPPFSPAEVCESFAGVLRSYGLSSVTGDRWSLGFVEEGFKRHGIDYVLSERTASQIFAEALAMLNSGLVELLDNKRLINQLCTLERRVSRGSREQISHPPGGHDDLAVAACGSLVLCGMDSTLATWIKLGEQGIAFEAARAEALRRQPAPSDAIFDVMKRAVHYGPPGVDVVRLFVRQAFGVRFDSHSEPLRFHAGLNDVPPQLLSHSYVKAVSVP